MADDTKPGIAGALDARGAGLEKSAAELRREIEAEPVQPDMLAEEPLFPVLRDGVVARTGRAGRPRGSRNKRTAAIVDYILERYRDPLIALAEITSTPLEELARGLFGLDPHRYVTESQRQFAAEFWRKCNGELAGYLHQRQPQAIDLKGSTAGMLVVQFGAPLGAAEEEQLAPFGLAMQVSYEIQQNQEVSGSVIDQSDAPQSDEEAK